MAVRVDDARPGLRSADAGDTMIELLVALVIVAIVVAAMFNGLMAVTRGSTVHRSTANVDTLAKSYLEAAVQQIEQPTGGLFTECASADGSYYTTHIAWTNPASYTGYAAPAITSVQYWSPGSSAFGSVCSGNTSNGLQSITVRAVAPDGSLAMMSTTVRNPAYSASDCNALGSSCS